MSPYERNTMTVSHEIKSQLAKLLATEDLVVEHKKVETACFNVHTRVLTLPMWEKAGNEVYDMLVAHEVGHALYTPDRNWLKETKIPPQFVNIVEDVRIEKLMKRRYPGLPKTFYAGYQVLAEEDFFGVECDDVTKMNLADRVNLYFKIGNFIDVPFGEDLEMPILRMIEECEDFDDVLLAAKALYTYCQNQLNTDTKTEMDSLESQSGSPDPSQNQQGFEQGDTDTTDDGESSTAESGETTEIEEEGPCGGIHNDVEIKTVEALENAIKDLASTDGYENVYVEVPKLDLEKIIVPNSTIHQECREMWDDYQHQEVFGDVDAEFTKFKKSAQKEVNYLVKEFECRKSADSYARATVSRTGVLDTAKLHTYRYNEDLFKKVTTLADGKNHGLIFILDWSGSMGDVLLDTVKQMCNLVWFCKKVGIPFDVYAFTNEYPLFTYKEDGSRDVKDLSYEKRDGVFYINEWFSMMNFLTHKVSTKELETQMKHLFRLAYYFDRTTRSYYHIPPTMGLSGTPLNETMIALHQILPKFKKENKVQKVQCVVLTDGEGYPPKFHREIQRHWEHEPFIGTGSIGHNCFLRNRKTGHTYSMDVLWNKMTDVFLEDLKTTFPDVNFIGIRVLASRDAGAFIRTYCGYNGELHDKVMKDWKKQRSFSIKTSGYHSYFGLSGNVLSSDSEFDVDDGATKTQIKSAFVKSLRTKKMNKKILNEFIELVA